MPIITLFLLLHAGEPCTGPLTRDDVIDCAAASSPRVLADRELVDSARGDERAARAVLPSSPEVEFSAAYRQNRGSARAVNYYGKITQEIELARQRRQRMDAAQADREAASRRVEVSERDVIAEALAAYYDALAAQRELEVLEGTAETASLLEAVARERSRAGTTAPIEIDLAEAEKAGVREQVELARGRVEVAQTRLAILVGLDPSARPEVRGDLDPLAVSTDIDAVGELPELAEAGAKQRAARARLSLLQRTRVPNLRLQLFVQNDGFNELVLGGGLSMPIPMPSQRVNKGAIQAARADIREAETRGQAVRRGLTLEAAVAERQLAARRRAMEAYPEETIARARQSLQDLANQASAGRLDLRSALLTQKTLLELLLRSVRARHELCLASVELARALGELQPRKKERDQ